MSLKSCLVLGSSGLIGTALCESVSRSRIVHGVSRHRPMTHERFHWTHADFTRPLDMGILPPEVDAVVYLAQSEQFRDFPASACGIFEVNTATLLRALDYARGAGARHFVFASSGGVYGTGDHHFAEDHPVPATGELGFYLSTKLCSEILSRNYAAFFNVSILRLFFVYGAGQRRNMLIPRLVDNVREGRAIDLGGRDGIRINPTHVSDAVRAIEGALALEGSHTINIAGPEVLSLRDIGDAIGRAVGRAPEWNVNDGVALNHIVGDIDKMTRLLGVPTVGFAEGLRASAF